ncbi:MAG: DedA family protein [Planctomycetota bacterium]|nr:DedA family protein [Planctomycetota bacterium]
MHYAMEWITSYGYSAIFVLLALGIMGLPVPDEVLLTFIGYLASRGESFTLPGVFAAGLAGAYAGICGSYFLGRLAGVWFIEKHGKWFGIDRPTVDRFEAFLERFGKWAIVLGFYVPGVRHLTALTAGATKMRFRAFAPFAIGGATLWASLFILTGYFLGDEWRKAPEAFKAATPWLIGVAVVVAIVGVVAYRRTLQRAPAPPSTTQAVPPSDAPPPAAS